jgi:hypothetical protein
MNVSPSGKSPSTAYFGAGSSAASRSRGSSLYVSEGRRRAATPTRLTETRDSPTLRPLNAPPRTRSRSRGRHRTRTSRCRLLRPPVEVPDQVVEDRVGELDVPVAQSFERTGDSRDDLSRSHRPPRVLAGPRAGPVHPRPRLRKARRRLLRSALFTAPRPSVAQRTRLGGGQNPRLIGQASGSAERLACARPV